MNDSALAQLLRERNPWWRDAEQWARDDDYLREAAEAPFDYRPGILADAKAPGLYVLRGPRRVGKSVELKRAIHALIEGGTEPRSIVYCACNGFREQDLRRLFTVGRNLTRTIEGPRYWFLDEVTSVAGRWPEIIKDARDDTPVRRDCLVLTGSSAKALREAERALAGRRGGANPWQRLLLPMGFRDFCLAIDTGLRSVPAPEPTRPRDLMTSQAREQMEELSFWIEDLVQAWELHLDVGGFPRAVSDFVRTGSVAPDFIEDLWSIAKEDAFGPRMEEASAAALLNRLAVGLTSPLNATKVAEDIGLGSGRDVNQRIEGLVGSFLAWRCHRISSGTIAAKGWRKIYLLDPVVSSLGHRRDPEQYVPDATELSEQQLGFNLLRSLEKADPGAFLAETGVMYEAGKDQKEIDFFSPSLGLPIESKYTDRGWKQAALAIRARHGRGIVATRSTLDVTGDVWAVPTAILSWLVAD